MKTFQERILKDFDVRQEYKNGRMRNVYVYKGKYASWNKEGRELSAYRRVHLNLGILMAVLLILASFARVPLNSGKITGALTLASFIPMAVVFYGTVEVFLSKEKMYLRDCLLTRDEIFWGSAIFAILQFGNTVAGIGYMIVHGGSFKSAGILLLYLLTAVLAVVLFRIHMRLGYHEVDAK